MNKLTRTLAALLCPCILAGCGNMSGSPGWESSRTRYGQHRQKVEEKPRIPATRFNEFVLAGAHRGNTSVVIDISRQRAFLLVDGAVGLDCPISSGRTGKYTPRGTFRVSERIRDGKHSTIYGVEMPYWMRLSGTVYGVHAGYLPGYPASAGCVRLPADAARTIYENTGYGTRVTIVTAWDGG